MNKNKRKTSVVRMFTDSRDRFKVKAAKKKISMTQLFDDLSKNT